MRWMRRSTAETPDSCAAQLRHRRCWRSRPGYSLWHHGASQLGLGERAGLQTVKFVLGGILVVGFSIGVRQVLQSGRGANWGPTLLAAAGIGLEPA
jgi:hypothetical protein